MSATRLVEAVKALDLASVRDLLRAEPALARWVDDRGWTLLHLACAVNARELGKSPARGLALVKLLLARGLDPDAGLVADGYRLNPVFFAAARGRNRAVVELLVRMGVQPQGLFAAAWSQDLPMMKLLLHLGAEIDECVEDETPFLHAWKNQRFKAAALLVRAGAEVDFQDEKKLTALHYALDRGYAPTRVRWLVRQGASLEMVDADGVSARVKAERNPDPGYRLGDRGNGARAARPMTLG